MRTVSVVLLLFCFSTLVSAFDMIRFENDSKFISRERNLNSNTYDLLGKTTLETEDRVTFLADICVVSEFSYVLDQYNNKIYMLSVNSNTKSVPIPTKNVSTSIHVDSKHNIFVLAGDEILQLDRYGNLIRKIGMGRGKEKGHVFRPSHITSDTDGYLYLADTGNERVQIFNPKKEAIYIVDRHIGLFTSPSGISTDSRGNIIVSDIYEDRVVVFDDSAKFKHTFGKTGTSRGCFNYPSKVAVDAQDNIYILDKFNKRVQKFSVKGKFLAEIGNNPAERIKNPRSFDVDSNGEIWLINSRIPMIWRYGTDYFSRALKYYDTKEYQKALRLFALAMDLDAENQNAAYYQAYCYFELKNYEKACEMLEKARGINSETTCGIYAQQQIQELGKWFRKNPDTKGDKK